MSKQDDDAEKSHEPSAKKLADARKKGEIARSNDVTTAASYAGFLVAAISVGGAALPEVGATLQRFIAAPDRIAPMLFEGSGRSVALRTAGALVGPLAGWFLVPAVFASLAIVAQRSFVVTPEKLAPKLSRISPISNAKNKFGPSGLFEFGKSMAKLLIFSIVLASFIYARLPEILSSVRLTPGLATLLLFDLAVRFAFLALIVAAVIGAVDYLWQRHSHLQRNRMSLKELRDEAKEQEGDPALKQRRRQRGYDIATNRMMNDVPKADVVVTNPTHYAVALKWSRAPGSAPVCVAKGVDEVARRIRETAIAANVPLHRDPATARALHAQVKIGQQILPEHYQAVAAAIRFAEEMRHKASGAVPR